MSTKHALLPNEEPIMTSQNGLLTLTNQRVLYGANSAGQGRYISITLDAIASCGLTTRSYPLLLLLAAISIVAMFALDLPTVFSLFVTAVFILAYFGTRKALLTICSQGGQAIEAQIKSASSRTAGIDFLNAVEQQKLG